MDELVRERIDSSGWDVSGIATVRPQLVDKIGLIFLLDDSGSASDGIGAAKSWADDIGEYCTVITRRDCDIICNERVG